MVILLRRVETNVSDIWIEDGGGGLGTASEGAERPRSRGDCSRETRMMINVGYIAYKRNVSDRHSFVSR